VELVGNRSSRCWLATDPAFNAAEAAAAIEHAPPNEPDPAGDPA
jgi:hypothetical protein